MKITNLLLLFFVVCLLIAPSALAQEASPSGSLIQKLDELKKDIASKAAEIKSAINKKVQNKAIIGEIVEIADDRLVIQTLSSEKTVNFDEFTEIIGTGNKKIKITTLEESDNVASLGDFDDKNNMLARRIVFLEKLATQSGVLIWGQIQKTTGPTINLADKSGNPETISTNSATSFFLGNSEASILDAKAEKFMIVRGTRQNNGSIRARFIYFIPAVGFVKPSTKEASNSAGEE